MTFFAAAVCRPARQLRPVTILRCTFSTSKSCQADFTHAIIGGGAVGLAIARQLTRAPQTSTLLLEKHSAVGTETSSRNSEVIHAGLYYGSTSLKTRLCLRGKHLLYDLCEERRIPYRKCGKWIVAQNENECEALEGIHALAQLIDVPTRFVPADEVRATEPNVRAQVVLDSPTTGILDSHAYCQYLQSDFQDRGGEVALQTQVKRIEREGSGWRIHTVSPDGQEGNVTTDILVNSAGLYACEINNLVLPPERHRKPFYAKGSYYSYNARRPSTKRLVYPAPVAGHGGLGTHLTLDLNGAIRFGPDVEWVDSPTDLAPTDNDVRFEAAVKEIQRFLPGVNKDALALSYAGIRPKLGKLGAAVVAGKGKTAAAGFQDFYIEMEEGCPGFVNLLAIESPGLTSSLAIAEYVHKLIYA